MDKIRIVFGAFLSIQSNFHTIRVNAGNDTETFVYQCFFNIDARKLSFLLNGFAQSFIKTAKNK
ncbi:hypothetical protein SDC9_191340 [bioreactor metagenome]|uniref:Uncharacterized protein n=1 Tax=bioreactor metagenome TaxID=1076179 RepID=A0A645HY32_9ZZZZ